jgi:geranylgeranyl diphosphate synthase type II
VTSFDLDQYRQLWKPRIDAVLSEILDKIREGCPEVLREAMRHAVLGGGKRLRPILCIAAARACGGDEEKALWPGCALELIHAYSLVHDDLPCMDDDDVRRGKPACHKAFGEATAILAGDALLTHAFYILAKSAPGAVGVVAELAGPAGMVGGQVDDVRGSGQSRSEEETESIHSRKTAVLFIAAVGLGGLVAGASEKELQALSVYGRALGLAFQVTDDLMDGDRQADPAVVGRLVQEAADAIKPLGEKADALLAILDFVKKRV